MGMSLYRKLCYLLCFCETFVDLGMVCLKVRYRNSLKCHIFYEINHFVVVYLYEKVSNPDLYYVCVNTPALPRGWTEGMAYGLSVQVIVKCNPLVNNSIEGKPLQPFPPQLPKILFVS